jgi:hypothetical protein
MTLVTLTVMAPRTLEEKLVQLLLEDEVAGAAGFTVHESVAYGRGLEFHTVSERIGGRIRQIEIRLGLLADVVPSLIERLRSAVRNADVTWRVTPVSASGSLG